MGHSCWDVLGLPLAFYTGRAAMVDHSQVGIQGCFPDQQAGVSVKMQYESVDSVLEIFRIASAQKIRCSSGFARSGYSVFK